MKKALKYFLFFLPSIGLAQLDTTYFTSAGIVSNQPDEQAYFELNNGQDRNGLIIQYYPTGEKYGEAIYVKNYPKGAYVKYYINGQVKERGNIRFFNKKVGSFQTYYPNGTLKEHIIIEKSDTDRYQIISANNEDGTSQVLNGEGFYRISTSQGLVISGKVKNREKQGEWRGLENGQLIFEEVYSKGKLKKGISYDEQGNAYPYKKITVETSYRGGFDAWNKYLSKNLNYPQSAIQNDIQGAVYLSFIVDKDGSLEDIKITQGLGYGCDEEAIRLLKMSKNWQPASIRGKYKRSRLQMKINYQLRK